MNSCKQNKSGQLFSTGDDVNTEFHVVNSNPLLFHTLDSDHFSGALC